MRFALVAFILAGLAVAAPQFPSGAGGSPKGKPPGGAGGMGKAPGMFSLR
jgi:hypothetical protein